MLTNSKYLRLKWHYVEMIIEHHNKFLTIEKKYASQVYSESHQRVLNYVVLNGLKKLSSVNVQQIYGAWFSKSNEMIYSEEPVFLHEACKVLLQTIHNIYSKKMILILSGYFFRISLVAFTTGYFSINKFVQGHVVTKESILKHLETQLPQLSKPNQVMEVVKQYSENKYIKVDIEQVYQELMKHEHSRINYNN